jgi:hypothetical protein
MNINYSARSVLTVRATASNNPLFSICNACAHELANRMETFRGVTRTRKDLRLGG